MKTKLIQTKDYLLLIDEEAEIKVNDLCLIDHNVGISTGYEILVCEEVEKDGWYHFTDFKTGRCSKIIAYYPLNSEAKELDLPLLPNPFEEVDVEKLAYAKYPVSPQKRKVFIEGYKAAQFKQFSLEDMEKKADVFARINFQNSDKADFLSNKRNLVNFAKQFIQSLSTQQLPKEFIPEYNLMNEGYNKPEDYPYQEYKVLKTITNSEGKEELVGTYRY